MGLDDLIARLEQDADAQVIAIARDADDQIAAITAATEQALSARAREALAAARHERQQQYTRALADYRRQLRASELTERHTVIERVFVRANALAAREQTLDEWSPVWPAVAVEALSYAGSIPCRLRAGRSVAALLREARVADGRADIVEDPQVGPGFVVEAIDGTVRIDVTIDALLAQRREHLAIGLLDLEAGDGA
jgi:vacuolar-type H+-ATPase subunit E/Vma4